MPVILRLARLDDAYTIALMSRELIETGLGGWSWPPARVARAIRSSNKIALVSAVHNHLIGFAIAEFGDVQAHVSLLAVSPLYQRCGLGTRMLEWLEASALVAGIATITLEMRAQNHDARDFYRKLGFKEAGFIAGYYGGVETALRMTRDIRRHVSDPVGDRDR
jgi:ribosomal protein S18 acetylase RimI-like enzyme